MRALPLLLLPSALLAVSCSPKERPDTSSPDTADTDGGGNDDTVDSDSGDSGGQETGPDTGDTGLVPTTLFVNEFMAANGSTIQDVVGEYSDWIELYNAGKSDLDLAGYTITDDLENPGQFPLSEGLAVPAGGWLLLWADARPEEGADHLGFCLARGGEAIGLYSPEGRDVQRLAYSTQATDWSAGRFPDGGEEWQFDTTPTPGVANTAEPSPVEVRPAPPPARGLPEDCGEDDGRDDDDD